MRNTHNIPDSWTKTQQISSDEQLKRGRFLSFALKSLVGLFTRHFTYCVKLLDSVVTLLCCNIRPGCVSPPVVLDIQQVVAVDLHPASESIVLSCFSCFLFTQTLCSRVRRPQSTRWEAANVFVWRLLVSVRSVNTAARLGGLPSSLNQQAVMVCSAVFVLGAALLSSATMKC